MPKGYVIMTEVIHDPAGMAAHGAVTYDSLVEHRAKMLVVDADYEVREGTWEAGSRLAIMEFESPDVARHWYESEAGQEAHMLRRAAADCNVLIASGFVPKNPGNKLAAYPRTGRPVDEGNRASPSEALGPGARSRSNGGPARRDRRWGPDRLPARGSAHRQRSSPGGASRPGRGPCRRGGSGRGLGRRHGCS